MDAAPSSDRRKTGRHRPRGTARRWHALISVAAVACALASASGAVGQRAEAQRTQVQPTPEQVARASVFASERGGLVSFAVIDTSGRLRCHECWRRYVSASVVKAMLLVAYLKRLHAEGRPLTPSDRALLAPMIQHSANGAATAVYWRAGADAALYRLARSAAMKRFDVYGSWGSAQVTAADQARFFSHLKALTPRRFRSYARLLLSSIVRWQSWGIPELSRPRWKTFFKGGWRGTSLGQLVHQVALLERGGASIAIAILTDANPSHGYGRDSVRGLAANLLRVARGPGKPWLVPLPDWFWGWARWYLHRSEFRNEPVRSLKTRPTSAPRRVPLWAWARLKALLPG